MKTVFIPFAIIFIVIMCNISAAGNSDNPASLNGPVAYSTQEELGSTNNIPYKGVNVFGYYTTMTEDQNRVSEIPDDYYEESFRIFSQAGMNLIRFLFTWESYEKNPSLFVSEMIEVAKNADRFGIKVIYANDQHHISSWLDQETGYGFPYFLFKNNVSEFPQGGGGASNTPTAQRWWTNWYDQPKVLTESDKNGMDDGWTLQADFLRKVIEVIDRYESTLGYEILNEPIIYSVDQWEKIGNYNTFIASELRKSTQKIIAFDRQLPSGVGGPIDATPENMVKMAPKNVTNLLFKTTLYGVPIHCSFAEARLNTAAMTAQLLGIPLWMGEFNKGITSDDIIADINQTELNIFIEKFEEMRLWGWSFWLWSFTHHSPNTRNYDLADITKDNISPTKYFDYLRNAVLSAKEHLTSNVNESSTEIETGDRVGDTICPTGVITQIGGAQASTDYSTSSQLEPIEVYVGSTSSNLGGNILVEGEAYDTGSGVKSVEIHLDDQPYQAVIPKSTGDLSSWSALVPTSTDNIASNDRSIFGNHKLVTKIRDNAGNVDYDTIFIRITNETKIT